jgi:hypothetical protein
MLDEINDTQKSELNYSMYTVKQRDKKNFTIPKSPKKAIKQN